MGYIVRSGAVRSAHPLAGDDYLRYLNAEVEARDRKEDGSGLGVGASTIYYLVVYGPAAEALDQMVSRGDRPQVVFAGRHGVRRLGDGSLRHEVAVDFIGLDLDVTPVKQLRQ